MLATDKSITQGWADVYRKRQKIDIEIKKEKYALPKEENQYLLKKIRQSGLNNFQNYA